MLRVVLYQRNFTFCFECPLSLVNLNCNIFMQSLSVRDRITTKLKTWLSRKKTLFFTTNWNFLTLQPYASSYPRCTPEEKKKKRKVIQTILLFWTDICPGMAFTTLPPWKFAGEWSSSFSTPWCLVPYVLSYSIFYTLTRI